MSCVIQYQVINAAPTVLSIDGNFWRFQDSRRNVTAFPRPSRVFSSLSLQSRKPHGNTERPGRTADIILTKIDDCAVQYRKARSELAVRAALG